MSSVFASPTAAWPVPGFLKGSIGVHVLAGGAAALMPQYAGWALAAVAANHAALTTAGLLPRCRLLGPNITRLPIACADRRQICLTIDDGPDPQVTPQVLDLLDAHGMRASFFCIGERALAHPALTRQIVARGHDIHNHSFVHCHDFSLLGPRGFAREIERGQQALFDVSGRWPRFFRAPAGLRNPFLEPVLHRLGLRLVSWTRRGFDTREKDPHRVLKRLISGLDGGDIMLLHDGHAARSLNDTPVIVDVLPGLADEASRIGLHWTTLNEAHGLSHGSDVAAQPATEAA